MPDSHTTTQWRAHALVLGWPNETSDKWRDGERGRQAAIREARRMSAPEMAEQYADVHLQSRQVSNLQRVDLPEEVTRCRRARRA